MPLLCWLHTIIRHLLDQLWCWCRPVQVKGWILRCRYETKKCFMLSIFRNLYPVKNHSDGITDPKKYKYSNKTLNRPLSVTKAARDCVTLRYNARALRMTCGQLMSPCALCTSCKSHFCRRATKVRVRNYCYFPHHNFWYVDLCQVEEQTVFQSAISCIPGKLL